MKSAAADIVGRKITGIVVKESTGGAPLSQVFLLFEDGLYYEFYSRKDEIKGAGGIDSDGLEGVLDYMAGADRWPIFGHVANRTEDARVQDQIALGQIVSQLREEHINEDGLVSMLSWVRDAGHDFGSLYLRALSYRPAEWPAVPSAEDIAARVNKRSRTSTQVNLQEVRPAPQHHGPVKPSEPPDPNTKPYRPE